MAGSKELLSNLVTVKNIVRIDEVKITFVVDDYHTIDAAVGLYSPTIIISNLPWKFCAQCTTKDAVKYLSFYVHCGNDNVGEFHCKATVEVEIVNQKDKNNHFRLYDRTFSPSILNWGWKQFIEWSKLVDPKNGYLKGDTVTFQIKLRNLSPLIEK